MKSKKATYFLIVSVIAVWGIIIYRLLDSQTEDAPVNISVQSKIAHEPLEDYTIKDTLTLLLNYRDPFLGKEGKGIEKAEHVPTRNEVHLRASPVEVKPAVNWDIIKYTGFISNPASKKKAAIMNISGHEYMLTEGQSAAGVKLIANLKDSVKVAYHDKFKFIRIQ